MDNDRTLELCAFYQKIEKVFEINGKSSGLIYALTYNRAGHENEATSSIIDYLESWTKNEMAVPNPILFSPTIKFK